MQYDESFNCPSTHTEWYEFVGVWEYLTVCLINAKKELLSHLVLW